MQAIHHDATAARFHTELDGHLSVLDYRLDDREREVTFTHTYVPDALRGRGVAAHLVEAGLHWARGLGYKVVPACSYVRSYMQRHPQTLDLLADENP